VIHLFSGHRADFSIPVRTKHGLEFYLDPGSHIDSLVLRDGFYEEEVLEAILQSLPRGAVLWDIGTNIGLHAITTKAKRPDATVICFEPSPFVYVRLVHNAKQNRAEIQALNIALSDQEGYSKLSMMETENPGLSSLSPWKGVEYSHSMLCRCESADTLVQQGVVPFPNVIKLDVEGHEMAVLNGLGSSLKDRQLSAIIFEAQSGSYEEEKAGPVFQLLSSHGFEISGIASTIDGPVKNYLAARRLTT
jgi:FkbM family methyltransferase